MFQQPQSEHDLNTIPSDTNHNHKLLPLCMKKHSIVSNIVLPKKYEVGLVLARDDLHGILPVFWHFIKLPYSKVERM